MANKGTQGVIDTSTEINGADPKAVAAAWANPATRSWMEQNAPETKPKEQTQAQPADKGIGETLYAGAQHGATGFYNEPEQQFNEQYGQHPIANAVGQAVGAAPYTAAGTAIGGALGLLGGPAAEVTVPIGAALGGAVGSGAYSFLRKKDVLDEQGQPMTFQNTAPSVGIGALLGAIPGGIGGNLLEKTALGAGIGYGSDIAQNAAGEIEQGQSPLQTHTLQPGLGTIVGAAAPAGAALGGAALRQGIQSGSRFYNESPILAPFKAAPRDLGEEPPPGSPGLPPPNNGGGGGGGGLPPTAPNTPTAGWDTLQPDLRGQVQYNIDGNDPVNTLTSEDLRGPYDGVNLTAALTPPWVGGHITDMMDPADAYYGAPPVKGAITSALNGGQGHTPITQTEPVNTPPQGAQPGQMDINVVQLLNPNTVVNFLKGPFKDKLIWAMHTLRDATDTLGLNAKQQVAKAQQISAELTNEYQNPVAQAAQQAGYDGNPEIDNKINTLFGETQRGDIYNGKVDLTSYGIPQQLHGFVALMDKSLKELITAIGFVGKGNYNFQKGFVNQRGTPTVLWSPETGKAAIGMGDPNEFKYSAIFHHRKEEGPAPDDKNILQAFLTHTNKLIRQAAVQPFHVLIDEAGNPLIGGDGNFIFVPDPNAPYTFFRNIVDDKNATEAQKLAAQTVVDSMINKPLSAVDRFIRQGTANFISSVLTQRVSAGLKNYPTVFATSRVPITTLLKAATDSVTNDTAKKILAKYNIMTFKDIEEVKANILYKSKLKGEGADMYQALEHHARGMTFLGSIYDQMQKYGITDLKSILNKTDPHSDAIIQEAYAEISRTQPNWSEFTGRPALQSSVINLALIFKQSKLTEMEQVVHFIKAAKQGNPQPLMRYMGVKYLIGGPSNFISPATANLILNSGAVTDPGAQQMLEDARDGTMAEKMIQSSIPDYNISIQKTIGTPLLDTQDIPGMEGNESVPQNMVKAGTMYTNPPEGATWQDKAIATIRAAEPAVSATIPSANVGGVKVSPNFLSRLAVGGINMTRPSESFAGGQLPINQPSEAIRGVGLAAGNVDKDRLGQYDQDRHVLVQHLRNKVESKQSFTKGETVEFNRFFNNYQDKLAKQYDGKFKTQAELKNLVKNNLKGDIQDSDGRLKLSRPEWNRVSSLIEQSRYYKQQGDEKKATQFKTAFEQEQKTLQKKYPQATTQYLMDKFMSSKQ